MPAGPNPGVLRGLARKDEIVLAAEALTSTSFANARAADASGLILTLPTEALGASDHRIK